MTIGPLGRPSLEATPRELRDHFIMTNPVFAMLTYEDAIHTCLVCGTLGENMCGKEDNPAGRNRFCSRECEAVFKLNQARCRPQALLEEKVGTKGKSKRTRGGTIARDESEDGGSEDNPRDAATEDADVHQLVNDDLSLHESEES